MKVFLKLLTLSLMWLLLMSCRSGIGGADTIGIFYSDVTHSESRDTVIGTRPGEACQVSFLSLISSGNNSIPQAALVGSIREVYNITYRAQSILMGIIWQKNCTIVYGK